MIYFKDITIQQGILGEPPTAEATLVAWGADEIMEFKKLIQGTLKSTTSHMSFAIKKVIFNNPATIVLWKDGTKTVVKCGNGDVYDKEKGLALCFMKKALGNKVKGKYQKAFEKYIKESK